MSIITPTSSGSNTLARPGTSLGDQKRDEFIHDVLDVCGDVRYLWLPKTGDTTTNTSVDRNTRTTTYAATVAGLMPIQGSGLGLTFDAAAPVATIPDAANLTFGDAALDEPFSIFAWLSVDATAAAKIILSKYDLTTGSTKREYLFAITADEYLRFDLYDESAGSLIGRAYNVALATGTVLFVAGTYSGSAAATGIRLYSAAAQVDDTNTGSGIYVAMEDTAALLRLGAEEGADGAAALVYDGNLYCVGLTTGALDADELWALKALGNAYFDVAL